ncbi:hypothetical protein BGZ54_008722 [Gamsiella multidivaricata]|nr:hypothetical protein BGZ54_008722 [Gamsiella multidivaricata]
MVLEKTQVVRKKGARRGIQADWQLQPELTITMVKKIAPKSSGNAITNFIRQEITAPEKRAGNTSIAISLTVFGLAVTFLRSLGDMLGV